jgi:hypothetical protein
MASGEISLDIELERLELVQAMCLWTRILAKREGVLRLGGTGPWVRRIGS